MKYVLKFYVDGQLDYETSVTDAKKAASIMDNWLDLKVKALRIDDFSRVGSTCAENNAECYVYCHRETYVGVVLTVQRIVELERKDKNDVWLKVGDSLIPDWAVGCDAAIIREAKLHLAEECDSSIWLHDNHNGMRVPIDMVDLSKFYKLTDK